MRRWAAISSAAIAVALLTWASGPALPRLRDALRQTAARSPAFGSQDTIRLLRRLEEIHLVAGENARWRGPRAAGRRAADRDVDCPPPLYAAGPQVDEELPSSLAVSEAALADGVPVFSIAVQNCSQRRLTKSPLARGRDWEEPVFVSYYEAGQLRFASAAGLRLHGGVQSRTAKRRSYRIVFRDVYGRSRFLPGVVTEDGSPGPVELVVHNDRRQKGNGTAFHFVNPLAYDIARRLGGITPETKPVRLVFNGHVEDAYVLGERINDDFLRRRFGHSDFDLVRGREPLSRRQAELNRVALERVAAIPSMTIDAANRIVDVDNLTQWFVTVFFTNTRDAHQAAQLRDRRDPEGKWFWIHWDLDWAFRGQGDLVLADVRGGRDSVKLSRAMLARLFEDSREYRAMFVRRVLEALNHRLDRRFLDERLAHYRAQALQHGLEDLDFLARMETFLRFRPAVVRRQLQQRFELGSEVSVRLQGPQPLHVDGLEVTPPWQGTYFEGMSIELSAADPQGAFDHWRVGEQSFEDREITLELQSDVEIVAVYDG